VAVRGQARSMGTLPAELNSFVGRRRELAETRRLLSASRLLTLTGPGGVGKTRLAMRLADQVRRAFPDGVWLVELASLHDPALLPQTVARALGLRDAAAEPATRLADYLKDKRLLLFLDNCEHLVDACAVLAGKLLAAAPGLSVLATSRHVLGVEGEQILPIPPLPLPAADEQAGARTAHFDAVTLFADRAVAAAPGFELNDRNRDQIVGICQRLDGIPLAIELAAVRLRALSTGDILDRLDDRFHLLIGGSRTAPSRQRTLSAAIDWSYDLCSQDEQSVWARLSVFAGGFDLDAAEYVGAGGSVRREDVLGLVSGLLDKSILIRQPDTYGRWARYQMLETIRAYGLTRLSGVEDEQSVRTRHLEHYQRLAAQYQADCFGPHQVEWIQRLLREHPNVRAALQFGLTTPGQASAAMDIAAALWNFWFSGGLLVEGYRWLQRALDAAPDPTRSRAEALWTCAFLGAQLGEGEAAGRMLTECGVLADRFNDAALRAHLAECSGLAALHRGEVPEACELLERAVAEHRAGDNLLGLADSLILLAAARLFIADPHGADAAAECLHLCDVHGATWTKSYALWAVAVHKWSSGAHREGVTLIQEAIRLQRTVHDWTGLAYLLEVLAWCSCGAGMPARAAQLLGAANAVWRLSGARVSEAPPYQAFDEQVGAQARGEVGTEKFAAALARGGALTLEQVIAYALEEKLGELPDQRRAERGPETRLTHRELEIAELVAEGLTNKEIAARLTIAQRTAEGHVERVLTKFGFTSRAQIAAWVARHHSDR
jgi:predicted ATPase/DNA-binding CsgD family transcriptional regulator